ncbi:MAG TPA: nitrophenyl compound nitroreductase subunit ArsF family protein [Candidatus Krumholzibacteria bacterium]|nr:nitrophenyl compound nitroreductase subunit ArsF family protein [Candidatus Krumholzibacteria bacterium]
MTSSTFAAVVVLVAGGTLIGSMTTNSHSQPAPEDSVTMTKESPAVPARVIAYYFHTNYRCVSCRNIEQYTHEAIESGFPADLEDGHLVWRVVNVEEKGNEHFVKDYKLFTKSVVLVDERTGEWKNLPKVWELLGDPNKFIRYIQNETQDFIKGHQS